MINKTLLAPLCIVLLIPLFFLYAQRIQKIWRIKQWQRSLNLHQHKLIFQKLYRQVNGFRLSKNARAKQDAFDYTYGEIDFVPFIALMSVANPNNDTVFYDLGSGTGKAVVATAMVFPVQKSVGIELFPELHSCACTVTKQLTEHPNYSKQANAIKFILDDFIKADFDDATLIFINSTALFNPTWETLCARLDNLKHLITVITTSKPLTSSIFEVYRITKIQMSWGTVNAYIHRRKTNNN